MSKNIFKYVTKKTLKFGLAGAIGAGIGDAIFELFPQQMGHDSFFGTVGNVSLWAGIIGIGTAIALQLSQNLYLRKTVFSKSMIKTLFWGLLIGGLVGGLAQVAFALTCRISVIAEIISRILCWGIFGLGIGWGISTFIPNFPKKRAIVAGLIGGIMGGIIFRFSFEIIPDIAGRIIGIAILGFFIGLVISYMEEVLREAWLTVVWAKNETTSVALGTREIILGSSPKADIHLPADKNYPKITAIIELKDNRVFIENKIDNKRTELKNGSKITMGVIEVIINLKTTKSY
jgi:Ca-activated chloride channel family protein